VLALQTCFKIVMRELFACGVDERAMEMEWVGVRRVDGE
jgi:hypothetical protein